MELQRGMRDKLDKYVNLNGTIDAEMNISGSGVYDFCCFGVDALDKLSDDRYMIFYNQTSSPQGEITYRNSSNNALFSLNLSRLPMNIKKLVFTVSIDGDSTMGNISTHSFCLKQNGNSLLNLRLSGTDFKQEKAIITVEIYRKETWRINAVARGFNGGLGDLLKNYGGQEISSPSPVQTPIPTPIQRPVPPITPVSPKPAMPQKVNLQKGQKVSLVKGNNGLGEILINLNWKQPTGFFSSPIDLDLGCLYELKDGSKGTVQALGNMFGSLSNPPYIALDGDDRSGASANGENLRINGKMVPMIRRILVYTFIYDGIANWKGADGVVTVKCPGSPDIIVHMDEYGSNLTLCAIALLENANDTLTVEKIVNFYKDQSYADRAFGWGLRWTPGRK
jgi:tellurite resistance protein TerA